MTHKLRRRTVLIFVLSVALATAIVGCDTSTLTPSATDQPPAATSTSQVDPSPEPPTEVPPTDAPPTEEPVATDAIDEEDVQPTTTPAPTAMVTPVTLPSNFIDSAVPQDIDPVAADADLTQASVFAWQEFIALNWPAMTDTRDTPDTSKRFGDTADVLVWHTYRNKIEIYPGARSTVQGDVLPPPGFINTPPDYGYDAGPQYLYNAFDTQPQVDAHLPGVGSYLPDLSLGAVPACDQSNPSTTTPWINLDENAEIGLDSIFAGVVSDGQPLTSDAELEDRILFSAKANRPEYIYSSANGWYNGNVPSSLSRAYVEGAKASAPAASVTDPTANNAPPGINDELIISFPNNTIELKSAWRQLTDAEMDNGRFYTTMVRYYKTQVDGQMYNGQEANQDGKDRPCYVDKVLGLVALHIIQKTPSAPYFIYATFGHTDNILDELGSPVEDENGNLVRNLTADPEEPNIVATPATAANPTGEVLSPATADSDPKFRLYYSNTEAFTHEPQGIISINKRENDIPQEVINANVAAHEAIQNYLGADNDTPSLYYKLVNVQWKPATKTTAGQPYTEVDGVPVSTYYLSNIVVETDYNLQLFSGRQPGSPAGLISDFNDDGSLTINVRANGLTYNMGGCMGCHGVGQGNGSDFSFILAGTTFQDSPERADDELPNLTRYLQQFGGQ